MALLIVVPVLSGPVETEPALASEVHPIQISENTDLTEHSGFLPILVHGQSTGTYVHLDSHDEETSRVAYRYNLSESVVISLNYGGHLMECAATFYLAAAVTNHYGGIAIETQSAKVMESTTLAEAGEQCHELAQSE